MIRDKVFMYTLLLGRIACSHTRIKTYLDKYGAINVYDLRAQDKAVAYLLDEGIDELIELIPEVEVDLDEKELNLIRKNTRTRVLKNIEGFVFQGYPNGGKKDNGKKNNGKKTVNTEEVFVDPDEEVKTDTEEIKPKRKRRTKAEMEAARAAGTEKPKKLRKKKTT